MTKDEKKILMYAIKRLHDDDGWDDGICALKRLLNPKYKSVFDTSKTINYKDIDGEYEFKGSKDV